MNRQRYAGLMAAIWLTLGSLAGCGSKPSAEEEYKQAQALYAKGNRTDAVIRLKAALQQNANMAEARFMLGTIYNEQRDPLSAEKELRRAKDAGLVEGGRVTAELGQSLVLLGKFKEVLDEIKVSPAFEDRYNASIEALRGHAQLTLGERAAAERSLAQGAKFAADNPDVITLGARFRLFDRDLEGANKEIGRILERDPKNIDALLFRADVYRLQDKPKEALEVYGKVLETEPRLLRVRVARAMLLITQNESAAAEQDIKYLERFDRMGPLTGYLRALQLFRGGQIREAQESIQKALRAAPNDIRVMTLSAAILYSLGSFAQAEHTLSQVVRARPDDVYSRRLLAATLIQLNQGTRALEALEPLMKQKERDEMAAGLAGDAYMRMGEFGKAAQHLAAAVERYPKDPALRTRLAMSRIEAGDVERGIVELEMAASLDARGLRADYLLVLTHLNRGEFDKAIEASRGIEKKAPKSALPLVLQGAAYAGKNELAKARQAYEEALKREPGSFPATDRLARLDIQERNIPAARKRYEGLIAKDPKDARAMAALAGLESGIGNTAAAVKLLEQAAKADPASASVQVLLATAYVAANRPKEALAAARAGQAAQPEDPAALDALALAQMANGELNTAQATLTKALSVAPKSPVLHYRLASLKALMKDRAGAEASLRTALEAGPGHLESLTALGRLYLDSARFDDVLGIARQLRNHHPRLGAGWALEGDALMGQKKYPQALKAYEAAFALEKTGAHAVGIYMAQARAGAPAEATARLERWVNDNPKDLRSRRYLADAYAQLGKSKAAVGHLEEILKVAPDDPEALNQLAYNYQQIKDPRALEVAEKAYRALPASPVIADTLGWILVERGQYSRAVELLRKAAEQLSEVPAVRYHLAVALARSGDKVAARQELDKALAGGRFDGIEEARALRKQL